MPLQLALPFSVEELYGDYYEYLLIASPDPKLTEKIVAIKKGFYTTFQQCIAVKTRPHITIATLWTKETFEDPLVALMQKACDKTSRFVAGLYGFDGFKPSTLYIKVQEHKPFHQLAYNLTTVNDYLRCHGLPAGRLVKHPHLTIARRLSHRVYAKAMQAYAHQNFQDFFPVHELVLLKRRHQFDRCQQIARLSLSSRNSFLN